MSENIGLAQENFNFFAGNCRRPGLADQLGRSNYWVFLHIEGKTTIGIDTGSSGIDIKLTTEKTLQK